MDVDFVRRLFDQYSKRAGTVENPVIAARRALRCLYEIFINLISRNYVNQKLCWNEDAECLWWIQPLLQIGLKFKRSLYLKVNKMELFKMVAYLNNWTVAKVSSFSHRNFQALIPAAHAPPFPVKITLVPLDI